MSLIIDVDFQKFDNCAIYKFDLTVALYIIKTCASLCDSKKFT